MPMPHAPVPSASAAPPSASATTLPAALIEAYRQAWYGVWLPTPDASATHLHKPCVLQVDVAHPQLLQAMQAQQARQACLLTACNPLGQLQQPPTNRYRMQALRHALLADGWTFAPALGRDPQGQWPDEDSLLVWHMNRHQARCWGLQWEQNAVLLVGDDAIPRLECLR